MERTIESPDLNYDRVWLYQDGLPVCGRELELVDELARADSRIHRLLQHLREKGATIMGTESSELLVEEYQLFKNVLASGTAPIAALGEARRRALQDSLLKRRDQYIAQRINDTLPKGETGLVFLGMLHSVAPWLDKYIQVIYPVHQPLHKRAKVL